MADCSINKNNSTCTAIYTRRGAPASSLGSNGDVFFSETAPFNWYKKVNGAWVLLGALQNNGEIPTPVDAYTKTESDARYGAIADITKWEYDTELLDYGILYNRYAVDTGNLAPACYRVPTNDDFALLSSYLGVTAGGILKSTRTGGIDENPYWTPNNIGATDGVRFSALPSGKRNSDGSYSNLGTYAMFWTSTTTTHWYISNNAESITGYGADLKTGMSVRCLRDATEYELSIYIDGDSLGDVFDVDGNRYDTTLIGTQVWLTSNLKTTRYNNGAAIPRVDDPTTWGSFSTGMYCIYNNGELSDYQVEITLTDKLKPKNDLSVSAKHINGLGNYINESTKSALRCTPQMVTRIFDGNALTEVSVTHNLNTLSLVGTIYDIAGKSMKIDPPYCYFRPDTVNTVMVVTNDTTVHAISLIGVNDDCDSDYGAFCLGCENI